MELIHLGLLVHAYVLLTYAARQCSIKTCHTCSVCAASQKIVIDLFQCHAACPALDTAFQK